VSARGAAPGLVGRELRGGLRRGSTDHTSLQGLPAALLERLAAHGITTAEQWLALGAKRRRIFGITRKMCEQIDAAVSALKWGRP
jgi:hypothetical protein